MTPTDFKALRSSQGSQRQVAKRLGIAYRTLQHVEAADYGDPVPLKYQAMIRGLRALLQEQSS